MAPENDSDVYKSVSAFGYFMCASLLLKLTNIGCYSYSSPSLPPPSPNESRSVSLCTRDL